MEEEEECEMSGGAHQIAEGRQSPGDKGEAPTDVCAVISCLRNGPGPFIR